MRPLKVRADDRVLVLAPHPDDETLAAGCLIQRAVASRAVVRVLFATDGDDNVWAQRAVERRWRVDGAARARWGTRRRGEALRALAVLGVPSAAVAFLGLHDQGLTGELLRGGAIAVTRLVREIERFAPTILVVPAIGDRHPDHSALGVLARFALERTSPRLQTPRVLEYFVHDGPLTAGTDGSWRLDLSGAERARKRAAILAHDSQLLLRRRRLLAFADGCERFFAPPSPRAIVAHPIREAVLDGAVLRLRLRRTTTLGRFGASTLYVAIGRRRLRGKVPAFARAIGIVNCTTGAAVATGVAAGRGVERELTLPLGSLADAGSLFVKLRRQFGFFDEAGWREVPLATEPAGTAATPAAAPEGRGRASATASW